LHRLDDRDRLRELAGVILRGSPQRHLHLARDRPGSCSFLVEAGGFTDDREATAQVAPQVAAGDGFVPSVPQRGRDGESRVGGQRLGVDRQPRLAIGCQDVPVVQVGMDHARVDRFVGHEVRQDGACLLDEPARNGPGSRVEPFHQARGFRRQT